MTVAKTGFVLLSLMLATASLARADSLQSSFGLVAQQAPFIQMAQDNNLPISEREAANIAQGMVPGARVLKVKLLPSGTYAVTLRGDGKLTRVMVDGQTGAAN
ncbi:MAG: PepSY domain-containing protein [Proteobacteria bacterium]|nr:PepSY domain-containing protein [Pseudomonadota bacterium]